MDFSTAFSGLMFRIEWTSLAHTWTISSAVLNQAEDLKASGGTAMYEGVMAALEIIERDYADTISDYSPAIVVLTDGMANGSADFNNLDEFYTELGMDIPIFSIMFGDASDTDLAQMANLSRARVFDGRENLIEAFQQVKGYNWYG